MKRFALLGFACIASIASLGIAQSAGAATQAAIPHCPRTITTADNGKTIKMVKGSCLTLQLDQDLIWTTPESSNDHAVAVFDTETFAPDQAWGLRAVHRGDATITSTGRPNCPQGQPCPLFLRLFSVNIRVVPR